MSLATPELLIIIAVVLGLAILVIGILVGIIITILSPGTLHRTTAEHPSTRQG